MRCMRVEKMQAEISYIYLGNGVCQGPIQSILIFFFCMKSQTTSAPLNYELFRRAYIHKTDELKQWTSRERGRQKRGNEHKNENDGFQIVVVLKNVSHNPSNSSSSSSCLFYIPLFYSYGEHTHFIRIFSQNFQRVIHHNFLFLKFFSQISFIRTSCAHTHISHTLYCSVHYYVDTSNAHAFKQTRFSSLCVFFALSVEFCSWEYFMC